MTEEANYVTPTVICRVAPGTLETAVVDHEKGRAMLVFSSQEEAQDYRRVHELYPADEGFKVVSMSDRALFRLLEKHECTHVVTPSSWAEGEEGPDFFAVEDFKRLFEESPLV